MHEANFVRGLCGQLPQLFHRFISSSHSVTPKSGAIRKNLEKIVFSIHGQTGRDQKYTPRQLELMQTHRCPNNGHQEQARENDAIDGYCGHAETRKRPVIAKIMRAVSAGLLMFRKCDGQLQVLLVHPGGPFWRKKDEGAWSIPKGEYDETESPLEAAKREFEEETSIKPDGEFIPLDAIRQPSGKVINVWAFEGDCSPKTIRSNTFSMEWPPNSGHQQEFPEVDRADWFTLDDARKRIVKGQIGFLDRLMTRFQ